MVPLVSLALIFASPLTGESIPIRLFLAGYELTPTMRDINKKFSVRYYLNLVLIDEEERRYFKQQVGASSRTLGPLGHNTERPPFPQSAILLPLRPLQQECKFPVDTQELLSQA